MDELSLDDLLDNLDDLVTFPQAVIKIGEMLDDDVSDADAFEKVIMTEPALAANLLRIANSAHFSPNRDVDTISTAVTLVGSQTLRSLVLAIAASDAFKDMENDIVSLRDFWLENSAAAAMCLALARLSPKRVDPSLAMTAGLLHNVGQLVLFKKSPQASQAVIEKALFEPEADLAETTQDQFGYTTGDVGAAMLDRWGIPENLSNCCKHSTSPLDAPEEHQMLAGLVHVANKAGRFLDVEDDEEDLFAEVSEEVSQMLGIDEISPQELRLAALETMVDIRQTIGC